MKRSSVRHRDWLVIFDGRKALILQNGGDERYANLQTRELREHEQAPTRKLGSDRPAHVHESVGAARSAVEQPDLHNEAERAFIADLAHHLHSVIITIAERRLFIIAPPRALGRFREACSPTLRNSIAFELRKDWVNEPLEKIESQLFSTRRR